MRIRVKLTIILLACTLAPLVIVRIVDVRAIGRLSERVSEQTTTAVSRRVERELILTTNGIAEQMGEKLRAVTMIAQSQAELFSGPASTPPGLPAGGLPRRLFTADEFDAGSPDLPPLQDQPGWRAGGGRMPRVTYDVPVFAPAPGLSLEDPAVAARAAALAGTVDLLTVLSSGRRGLIRSQYVCLEDGLHMSFPGKGGYPAGYDGRERPWYAAGFEAASVEFIGPVQDLVTGETRMTCAAPVHAGERVIGVTAVDISLQDVLDTLELPPELALGSEALVVGYAEGGLDVLMAAREGGLVTVASEEPERLVTTDAEGLERLGREIQSGRSGAITMPRDGQDCVWAYAHMGPRVGVVMVVPVARIDAMTESVRRDLRTMEQETFRSSAAAVLIVIVLSFLVAYLIGRTLSRPIRRLADAAEAVSEGDLGARADVRPRRDEIGKLARAFNQMVPALADRMRLRESVALANELQQGLLPTEHPVIPGFDVFGVAMYCDETGGDYFDYLFPMQLGEGRYGVALGDVTGHGIPAALVMTSARALIQSHARSAGEPGEILDRVNETVARDASQGRFITLVLLLIETDGGGCRIRLANAGHDPGLIYRAESGVFDQTPLGGLPLAVDAGERYETFTIEPPAPGDVMLIATDGVWETRDEGGAFYGKERMREVVRTNAGAPAEAIGRALLDDLAAFRGSAAMLDDVTFIVMKATGGEPGSGPVGGARA